jgi:hypothetical protein
MTASAYPAARAVAARARLHFERRHAALSHQESGGLAPLPDLETIEAFVNAAFWASLRREEGYAPKISLAFLPPDRADRPLSFERPLSLAPEALARLAPAVEHPGIHLGVWGMGDGLRVWGATHTLPNSCFVVEVISPGLLVIKQSRVEESDKYVNVAVLEGEQIKVLDQNASGLPDCPDLLRSLLGCDPPAFVDVFVKLAVSMRQHGRGGSLLVVPGNSETWRDSLVHPIRYAVEPPFAELSELIRAGLGEKSPRHWGDALHLAVEAIAGLTAVDGATVVTDRYELVAFGAKIVRREGYPTVENIVVTEPIEGAHAVILHPAQLGGTRHLSAAQFVQDQRTAISLVASQDGCFTIFGWSPSEGMVHAHRIETLLL